MILERQQTNYASEVQKDYEHVRGVVEESAAAENDQKFEDTK